MADFIIRKPRSFGKDTISNPFHALNRLRMTIKNLIMITLAEDIKEDYVVNQYKKLIYHFSVPSWYNEHDVVIDDICLAAICMKGGVRQAAADYLGDASMKVKKHIKNLMVIKSRLLKGDEEENLGELHKLPSDIKKLIADYI